MCMSAPDMPDMPNPKPAAPPPPPPAPPAPGPQAGAAEKQGGVEDPGKGEKRKRKDRSSLRIPKNQSKGMNLPGSGGGNGGKQ